VRAALGRLADILGTAERYGAAALLVSMTFLYGFNVLVRALLPAYASAFAWVDEATRYMLIWLVFLATGLTLEVGRHVSVDIIRGRLRARHERLLFALIDVIGFAACAGASYLAVQMTLFVMDTGQTSPTLGMPIYLVYIAPAFGFASMAFRFLLRLLSVRDARRQPPAGAWLGSRAG
jgi:TRAP-type C4-dicarboxylate transport system permease small subunit